MTSTKKRVLVTGASGLIGGLVVKNLADKYGIDPRSWSAGAPEDVPSESPDDLFGGALVEALGGNDSDLLDEPDPQFASLEEVRDRD